MPLDIVAERNYRNTLMRSDLLSAEEEYELAVKWRDEQDEEALHKLIRAYMRLAISIAMKFSRYGVTRSDLTQEAAIGLLKAAEKFDPDRGVRFSPMHSGGLRQPCKAMLCVIIPLFGQVRLQIKNHCFSIISVSKRI